jgi:hypothetical protein
MKYAALSLFVFVFALMFIQIGLYAYAGFKAIELSSAFCEDQPNLLRCLGKAGAEIDEGLKQ